MTKQLKILLKKNESFKRTSNICTHHLKSAEDSKAGIDSEDAADLKDFGMQNISLSDVISFFGFRECVCVRERESKEER